MTKRDSFAKLFNKLEDNNGEKVKHDVAKFSLFVDSDNTTREKGRLSKTEINDGLKHPILLSAKHLAVVLIMEEMPKDNHHEGTECERSLFQQRFWVIGIAQNQTQMCQMQTVGSATNSPSHV